MARLGLMLGLAMPVVAVGFALSGLLLHKSSGVGDAFGGAFLLLYVWGALTGSAVSLLHSVLVNSSSSRVSLQSAILGLALGAAAGAITPTMFTGLFNGVAIVLGGLTGLLYGILVGILMPEHPTRPVAGEVQ
jgi:hypothetical protein